MASRQMILESGTRLGRYRILRELGRGGMGVVYLAHDDNLERQVALKTAQVASIGSSEQTRNQRRHRFIREVMALAQLSHENVVHVYDAGESDHPQLGWVLFYTMQYVEGITLGDLVLQRGAVEPSAAAAICCQIASGLGAGHSRGIVHRDVKPANVFLSEEGRALIGDFGIAKLADATQITRRDQMVGTPNFLAPEQILGDEATAATDIFALGALFYMITMRRPLRTRVDAAGLLENARGNAARGKMLSALAVPRGLRNIVARALEQDPAKRYPDGQAFAEALSDFATRIPSLRDEPKSEPVLEDSAFRAQFKTVDTDTFSAPLQEVEGLAPEHERPTSQSTDRAKMRARPFEGGASRTTAAGVDDPAASADRKRARTESTAVFNVRNLSLPEEMDFQGMEEELPTLNPVVQSGSEMRASHPRGGTESEEIFLLRASLGFLGKMVSQTPTIPEAYRIPLPPSENEFVATFPSFEPAASPRVAKTVDVKTPERDVLAPEEAAAGGDAAERNRRPIDEPRPAIIHHVSSMHDGSPALPHARMTPRPEIWDHDTIPEEGGAHEYVDDDSVFDDLADEKPQNWFSRVAALWRPKTK